MPVTAARHCGYAEVKQTRSNRQRRTVERKIMSRGQTWSDEEVKTLIEIWSDENIAQLLVSTHKNCDIYKTISRKMEASGYRRSIEQCRNKVKKLRQEYIKTRDSLRKSGTSPDEVKKYAYYDLLDAFLGTRPTSSPKHIVESFQRPPTPSSSKESDQETDISGKLKKYKVLR